MKITSYILLGLAIVLSVPAVTLTFDTDVPQPSVVPPLVRKDILRYDIYADFTREPITEYGCQVDIQFLALMDLDTLYFDLVENNVDSVFVDGVTAGFVQTEDALLILPEGVISGDTVQTRVFYRGEYPSDAIKYGFDLDGWGSAYSLFWPSLARFFYPCVDHPLDKALSSITLRTTGTSTVVSNGQPESTYAPADDPTELVSVWSNDHQICTYNICFSFSENYGWLDTSFALPSGDLPIRHFFPSEWETRARSAFADLPNMITLYDTLFGDFPFDNYGMYVTPFRAGAMEHQSMVMMGEFVLEDPVSYQDMIAHELSHQWWGDAVGLADWRDFWLNEGMAVYCEVLWNEFTYGCEAGMGLLHDTQQGYLDYAEYEGIFPVYDPDSYLSATVYNKGAAVFHMLRRYLGDDNFFGGMREYFDRYKYKNVTTDSLFAVLEEFSDIDLSTFRSQWVERGGWPVLNYWYVLDGSGLNLYIDQPGELYVLPMQVTVYSGGIESIHSVIVDESPAHLHFDDVLEMDNLVLDPAGDILCEKIWLEGISEMPVKPDDLQIVVYPNPFNSTLNVQLLNGAGQMEMLDISGRAVRSWDSNTTRIQMEDMPSGIYTVRISGTEFGKRVLLIR